MSYRIRAAEAMAIAAHDSIDQRRKYSGAPYWVHTKEVAELTASAPTATEDMICAAHLHDVLEDVFPANPSFNRQQIQNQFGPIVLGLVEMLTNEYTSEKYPHLDRAERKRRERERLSRISPEAMTVKLADIISNTRDIVEKGGDFASVYLHEKMDLLSLLKSGDADLHRRALEFVTARLSQVSPCVAARNNNPTK